jgi:hypothetical protein
MEELVLDLRRELSLLKLLLAGMQDKFRRLELHDPRPAQRRQIDMTDDRPGPRRRLN